MSGTDREERGHRADGADGPATERRVGDAVCDTRQPYRDECRQQTVVYLGFQVKNVLLNTLIRKVTFFCC